MPMGKHDRRAFLRYSALLPAGAALLSGIPGLGVAAQTTPPGSSAPDAMLDDPSNRQGAYAEVNGARIFYQVTGQGDPMLLIHGYPLSGALFSRVRGALSAQYKVITIDLRGYGMSTAPGIPDTIGVYAADALAMLDQLGVQNAIIGGMSMGGPITMEMYQRAPGRFRGMILIDTNVAAAKPFEAGEERGFAEMVQQQGSVDPLVPALIPIMLTGATRMQQPALANYLTTVVKAASANAAIGGAMALATRSDYMSLLSQVKVPTLILVGQADPLYPFEISQMMHQALPSSQLVIVPGGAHATIFEVPQQAGAAILNWAAGKPAEMQAAPVAPPAPAVFTAAPTPASVPSAPPQTGGGGDAAFIHRLGS